LGLNGKGAIYIASEGSYLTMGWNLHMSIPGIGLMILIP